MKKFIIHGGKKLKGTVEISGSKNAALPIIAATLLFKKACVINNVPKIGDVKSLLQIMRDLGSKIDWVGDNRLRINNSFIVNKTINSGLTSKLRASVLLIGPMLARFGKIKIASPGGCVIGHRSINTHIDLFKKMGVNINSRGKFYELEIGKLNKRIFRLKEKSVTATENAVIFLAGIKKNIHFKTVEIKNIAVEPEIMDLIEFLKSGGAMIRARTAIKTREKYLSIILGGKLSSAKHDVIPDRIEAATFIILAVSSLSKIKIKNIIPDHLAALLKKIREMGVTYSIKNNTISIEPSSNLKPIKIKTAVYPGLATDFQAPFSILLARANGKSFLHETLFEDRLGHIGELAKMGVKARIINSHQAEIYGPTRLSGAKINSLDLRSGATMVIAACCADGVSEIDNIEIINRGYQFLDKKLRKLGVDIKEVS